MQQVKQPKPPPELGVEGKKLWRLIVADAAGQGVELDSRELIWLRQAGKLADTIARMEADVVDAATVVPGYMNKGLQANPLLGELRMTRQLLAQTIATIQVDVPESSSGMGRVDGGGNRYRTAALSRWYPNGSA